MFKIPVEVKIEDYREMDDLMKIKAVNGDKEARKIWMKEEISEFYEAGL